MRMAGRAAAVAAVAMVVLSVPIQATASSYRCFHVYTPYQSYATSGGCRSGYVRAALPAGTAQLITVTNWQQTRTYALVNAFSLTGGSWTHQWGPWTARIGASGFADLGQKIEGDALTPQGSYGFQFMFGVNANPGFTSPGGTPTATTTGTMTRPAPGTTCGPTPGTTAPARIPSRCTTSPSTGTRR